MIARQKDLFDNAVPSGNSMAALVLIRLAKLTGRADLAEAAEATLVAATGVMRQAPSAAGQMLSALDMHLGPTPEIVIVGDPKHADTVESLRALAQRYVPNRVLACRSPDKFNEGSPALTDLFAGKKLDGAEPAIFICERFACQAPVYGPAAALAVWDQLAGRTE